MNRNLRKLVADFGWVVVKIPAEADSPGWCYTIGLELTFGHRELVVFGLPLDVGHAVLNVAGEAIRDGRTFKAGASTDALLEGLDCELRPTHPSWRPLLFGQLSNDGPTPEVVQIFWPDEQGRFPWDDGVEESARAEQPRLYEADPIGAGAQTLLASLAGGQQRKAGSA